MSLLSWQEILHQSVSVQRFLKWILTQLCALIPQYSHVGAHHTKWFTTSVYHLYTGVQIQLQSIDSNGIWSHSVVLDPLIAIVSDPQSLVWLGIDADEDRICSITAIHSHNYLCSSLLQTNNSKFLLWYNSNDNQRLVYLSLERFHIQHENPITMEVGYQLWNTLVTMWSCENTITDGTALNIVILTAIDWTLYHPAII